MRVLYAVVAVAMVAPVGAELEGLIGCFAAKAGDPDFEFDASNVVTRGGSAVLACRLACSAKGRGPFAYFGVTNDKCWCGNKFGKHGRGNDCTSGKDVAVYRTGQPTKQGSKASEDYLAVYMGCYKDKSPGRAFAADTQKDDDENTASSCIAHCVGHEKHFTYIALQDGNQCFCGTEVGDKHGTSDKCEAKKCSGGSGPNPPNVIGGPQGTCGGPFANQVYLIVPRLSANLGMHATSSASVGAVSGTVMTVGIPPNCGVPGAVLVVFLLVLATSVGSHGFFTSMVLSSVLSQATASVFVGALLSDSFLLVVSALLGHILPDSKMMSPYYTRLVSAVLCVGVGMVQVNKSFDVAGKDQAEKRDEFRMALSEVSRPAQKHDAEGDVVLDSSQDGPGVVYRVFMTVLLSQWGGLHQLTIVAVATVLNVNSVIAGGLAALFYGLSLSSSIAPSSVLIRNSTALKFHFLAGLLLFFLAMNSIFELND